MNDKATSRKPATPATAEHSARSLQRLVRRRSCAAYVTEKIEAYNIAIEALQAHEPADGDPSGIARKLRRALADKLDREIQKWVDAQPLNELSSATRPAESNK